MTELAQPSARGFWADAWRRLRRNRAAMVSATLIVLISLLAFIGPSFSPHSFDAIDWDHMAVPPGGPNDHWLGTDRLGRDLYVRTLAGVQISLQIRLLATLVSLCIGVAFGAIAHPVAIAVAVTVIGDAVAVGVAAPFDPIGNAVAVEIAIGARLGVRRGSHDEVDDEDCAGIDSRCVIARSADEQRRGCSTARANRSDGVTEEIVGCDAVSAPAGEDPSIHLGSIVLGPVADAERVTVEGGTEITFIVEVEPLGAEPTADADQPVDSSSVAILQARAAGDVAALLRVDEVAEAGAECCHARSDKFWSEDPQGTRWEAFHTVGSIATYHGSADGCDMSSARAADLQALAAQQAAETPQATDCCDATTPQGVCCAPKADRPADAPCCGPVVAAVNASVKRAGCAVSGCGDRGDGRHSSPPPSNHH